MDESIAKGLAPVSQTGSPIGFPTLTRPSLTAFRHGEPYGFLTETVHLLDFLFQKISKGLAKLQVFAPHPTPSFARAI